MGQFGSPNGRLMVVAPHTDDLELGAGATVHRLVTLGWAVHAVVLSDAAESLPAGFEPGATQRECRASLDFLGVQSVVFHNYAVRRFADRRQDILDSLIGEIRQFEPDIVIGPSANDIHQDHEVVARELLRAGAGKASVYGFDMPWNAPQEGPALYVEVSTADLDAKIKSLQFYESQTAKGARYFEEDFIRGLASVRAGRSKFDFAERFECRWGILPLGTR